MSDLDSRGSLDISREQDQLATHVPASPLICGDLADTGQPGVCETRWIQGSIRSYKTPPPARGSLAQIARFRTGGILEKRLSTSCSYLEWRLNTRNLKRGYFPFLPRVWPDRPSTNLQNAINSRTGCYRWDQIKQWIPKLVEVGIDLVNQGTWPAGKAKKLPGGESNPALPRDRRMYYPIYYQRYK
ncbi:hypothetical protein OE88DRAFT_1647912 [Heliocybe sulcata]|uniref:Uncharacterized protein n=1 Tax=Heliocybe sulcata TaxID=5364 RepID=A0A5C3MRA4_9AGAM|nr:hypothetical protein OE88DRAFT_1647912 [Heliocybe sulcata]